MKHRNIIKAFIYIWKITKVYIFLSTLFSLLLGLFPLISVTIIKELVNTVSDIISENSNSYGMASLLLGFQFGIMLLGSVIKHLQNYLDKKLSLQLDYKIKNEVFTKTDSFSFSNFDDPSFYNQLDRIQRNSGEKFMSPIKSVFSITSAVISMVSLLGFLFTIHWLLLVISVISFIPTIAIKAYFGNKNFWLQLIITPLARELRYIQRLLSEKRYIKEVRLFNLTSHFINRWSTKFEEQSHKTLKLLRRQKAWEISLDGITAIFYTSAVATIIWLTKKSVIKIGDFVAIGQAVQNTQSSVNEVSNGLAKLYEDSLFINDYFEFIEMSFKNQNKDSKFKFPTPLIDGIYFKNVSFKYNNSDKEVLKDVSCFIEPGEKIAIVGNNGSGKTTFIQCLVGLYKPTRGKIYFDSTEINQISQKSLFENISVIFQDFIKYPFTVSENIAFNKASSKKDEEEIKLATKKSGIHKDIEKFEEGYDTILGKYLYDGEDLSGGQWQKIAMARLIYKNSNIFVFDEPTASLDPNSELAVFRQFNSLSSNKTAFFISHRMAAAVVADRIIVMDSGEIAEFGTHEELLDLKGLYYEMYSEQVKSFKPQSQKISGVNY